ncbi:TPA: hypothetical protein ACJ5QC_001706 [Enterobacter hormaechei]|uniref:hypothetical protein n=1 Tax=Enterobacter TaxID=547 RepID=UPI00079B3135|nr:MULTISPECIES: hypothetical protein [Enterobacter]MCF2450508.1 hypothetical protein [Enterobacter sp. MV-xx2-O]MCK0255064.1 hypothetical protein [Enterobacter hormaechei]MCK0264030.1 hypothetical protein [Enterobacter hormaechei]MDX6942232.1 hypothetical protein [Enterobacter hormaechei]SAI07647.1 Uncharacterised protein [Enterobacter hormaechei]
MSNIDKHAVQAVADLKAGYTLGHADVAILNEMARIALASIEAEPVDISDDMAYAFHHALSDSSLGADDVDEIKTGLRAVFANITAPPAPVSMKDHQIRELVNELRDIAVEYHGTQQLLERIARTVRAAMLHGAEPVRRLTSCQS